MTIVLFDIDGTLINTGGAGRIAFADTFRELFGIEQICGDVKFAGRSDRAIALELMKLHDVEPSLENWQRFVTAFVPRLAALLPQCPGQVLPGVVRLLDELSSHEHVSLGLLTGNVAEGARAKLLHFDLWNHFRFGGYGDDCTDRSDIAITAFNAARAFHKGNATYGARVIVIGDTPADILCARAIDAFAVGVATGGASYDDLRQAEPDLLVRDLTDCRELLLRVAA